MFSWTDAQSVARLAIFKGFEFQIFSEKVISTTCHIVQRTLYAEYTEKGPNANQNVMQ